MCSVKSLKTLSSIRLTISLCTENSIKDVILTGPGLEYDVGGSKNEHQCEKYWKNLLIHYETDNVNRMLALPKSLLECVTRFINDIAKEMLGWCRYHSAKYNLPHRFSVNFLNESLFTCHGKINRQKAVEELLKSETLNVSQRFKLACGYMMVNDVSKLWKRMLVKERNELVVDTFPPYINESQLPNIWAHRLRHVFESMATEARSSIDAFWRTSFVSAVNDLNDIALRQCWDKLPLHNRDRLVMDEAHRLYYTMVTHKGSAMRNILLSQRCHIDMICVLLSKMNEDVMQQFLSECFRMNKMSDLLEHLMRYHLDSNVFFRILFLIWQFRPVNDILKEIIVRGSKSLFCNLESVNYNVWHVLEEWWRESSDRFKKLVLIRAPFYTILFLYCFDIWKLDHSSDNIFSNYNVDDKYKWLHLILENDELEVARWLIDVCGFDDVDDKKQWLQKELHYFAFTLDSSSNLNYRLISTLGDRCLTSFAEMNDFKRKWLSEKGKEVFYNLWLKQNQQKVDQFLQWCFKSEEDIGDFKKRFFHSSGVDLHCRMISRSKLLPKGDDTLYGDYLHSEEFYCWFGLTEEEILKLKRDSVFTFVNSGNIYDFKDCDHILQKNSCCCSCSPPSSDDYLELRRRLLKICVTDEEMLSEIRHELTQQCHSDQLCPVMKSHLESFIILLNKYVNFDH